MQKELEKKINYNFKNQSLLKLALHHKSSLGKDNERLEFLGDRVLGLAMADILYKAYPNEPEGDLARRHAALVCADTLAEIAEQIDLGKYLLLSKSEDERGGRENKNILSDACEALLGAIYLDSSFNNTYKIIEKEWQKQIKTYKEPPKDPKSQLQELTQEKFQVLPKYELLNIKGPDHNPIFTIKVSVSKYETQATGRSKKEAEHIAAENLIKKLTKK
jgi:ribonuclease-3